MENNTLPMTQHRREWESMLNHVGKVKIAIEIGTHRGGTALSMLENIVTEQLISIDWAAHPDFGIGLRDAEVRNKFIKSKFPNTIFIEGDSHSIKIMQELKKVLNGRLADLIFFDGGHKEFEVLQDVMAFKQFLKIGGIMAFHDIIKSDFHAHYGCFVDRFWNKYKTPDAVEYIAKDNSDITWQAPDFKGEFGGIGIMRNKQRYNLFQTFYDQQTFDAVTKAANSYLPTLLLMPSTASEKTVENSFFENNAIRHVYEGYKFDDTDYVGITSPRISEKTELTIHDLWERTIRLKALNLDVFTYGFGKKIGGQEKVYSLNRGTNLGAALRELNEANILPFKIDKDWTTPVYCNFWVAKAPIFKDYCETVLIPVMEWLKKSPKWCVWDSKEFGLLHRGKYFPISTFVCEVLMGYYLSNNKQLKINKNIITERLSAGICDNCKIPKMKNTGNGIDEPFDPVLFCEKIKQEIYPLPKEEQLMECSFFLRHENPKP